MKIWALSDLHLSFDETGKPYKPMGIFGDQWEDHEEKIRENWNRLVSEEDYVLVPGDISWALKLPDTVYDFLFLSKLNGKMIISKGNHDLWWDTVSKVREGLPSNVAVLQNECIMLPHDIALCGTRGWICPGEQGFGDEHDLKLYRREVERLKLSLAQIPSNATFRIAMLHFPPVNASHDKNEIIDLLEAYHVNLCIYGHLHNRNGWAAAIEGTHWGIRFQLVSGDYLRFIPLLLWDNS